jgi:OPT family oligopeptide transporter
MAAPLNSSPASAETASEPSPLGPGVPPMPEGLSPREKDEFWLKHVYRGDNMPQLTLRAVLMGGLLGMLMSASNLYTTLTIGWSFGVAITSCVMSFVIWNALRALTSNRLSPMSVLENNCMQSTAAAAGGSTGATIATMFGALVLLAEVPAGKTAADVTTWSVTPWWAVALFTLATACLGVFLAVPMKRQMINHEQLRFPSGIAAAETLRSLYSESAAALRRAYSLLAGLGVGLLVGLLNSGEGAIKALDRFFEAVPIRLPESIAIPFTVGGKAPAALAFEPSMLLIAAGVITRLRVSLSMFFGSVLLYFVVGPTLVGVDQRTPGSGWAQATDGTWTWAAANHAKDTILNIELGGGGTVLRFTTWALWGGTSLMVAASLTALALQWKTIARAFIGFFSREERSSQTDALDRIEVPITWMIIGLIPISLLLMFVQIVAFSIVWWAGIIAIGLAFVLSLVACRATGETDTTPIGAMGKVMQLTFAVAQPKMIVPNLAAAGVASNSAAASADLLTDLKSGYLLGANPRRQFIAQFCGVFFGTLAIVPVWYLMVPTKAALEKYQLPATRQWEAVARVLTEGIDRLPESARWAILIGAGVGILLPVLDRLAPAKVRGYLPSAMGLGLSWVIPFSSALSFAIGAIAGWIWESYHKKSSDEYAISVSSGLIAGESLMKAAIAMTATAIGLIAPTAANAPGASAPSSPAPITSPATPATTPPTPPAPAPVTPGAAPR